MEDSCRFRRPASAPAALTIIDSPTSSLGGYFGTAADSLARTAILATLAKDPSLYELENEARAARRGIWALPESEREAPWKWREERREPHVSPTPAAAAPQGPVIGNRRSLFYHRPDCPDYGKVSLKNHVYFDSRAAAETAGFHEARNCP